MNTVKQITVVHCRTNNGNTTKYSLITTITDFVVVTIRCVFFCGPIASGKTFIRHYMTIQGYLPVYAPIIINMDDIRQMLPESNEMKQKQPWDWGIKSQQESGLIAELISFVAISMGKSIIVDGTMKNISWNRQYITTLKSLAPFKDQFNVGVIHVTAKPDIIYQRVHSRNTDGITNPLCSNTRVVPIEFVEESLRLTDVAYLNDIKNHVDVIVSIDNSEENKPVLVHPWYLSWEGFQSIILCGCHNEHTEDEDNSDVTCSEISDLTETNCTAVSSDSEKSTNSLIITKTKPDSEKGVVSKFRLSISSSSHESNATDNISCGTCSLDGLPYCTEEKKVGNIAERILKRLNFTSSLSSNDSKEKRKPKRHSLPAVIQPPSIAEPKVLLKKNIIEELPVTTVDAGQVKLTLIHPDDLRYAEYSMPRVLSKSFCSILSADKIVAKGKVTRKQRSKFLII